MDDVERIMAVYDLQSRASFMAKRSDNAVETAGKKVNRAEFLARVSRRTDVRKDVVISVYNGFVDELVDVMQNGSQLLLTGFGSFYLQTHKGHPVQFSGGSETVGDYDVLKFSPSNIVTKRVRTSPSELVKD